MYLVYKLKLIMGFLELPGDIILKIIDIPWTVGPDRRGKNKQIRNDYKKKNPYNSLIKVNRSFNKRLSTTDILIPVVASYSARQMDQYELIYIGRQLDIKLDKSDEVITMKQRIYDTIVENKLNDKGNSSGRKGGPDGFRTDWWLRKCRRNQSRITPQ